MACPTCNRACSDSADGIESKLSFLIGFYQKQIPKKYIEWSERELNELGPILRAKIKKYISKNKDLILKVEYLNAMLWLESGLEGEVFSHE
ncbi:MAG: hypothetical protein ACR2QF_02565 [Geminicoccaceae bacterium]